MLRFAANLSTMFTDVPLVERFARAAAASFRGVEILEPYALPAAEVAGLLNEHGLEAVLFNIPAGDRANGERGLASLPGREEEFKDTLAEALDYAETAGCPSLHCLVGVLPDEAVRAEHEAVLVENLSYAAREAATCGITILIEPINLRDVPGYLLNYQAHARILIELVAEANLKLQFDVYHCQIEEGDLVRHLEALMPIIGHIQISGVPGRDEPDRGEVRFAFLFDRIERLGYQGWLGCEYRPRAGTETGLDWFQPYRTS